MQTRKCSESTSASTGHDGEVPPTSHEATSSALPSTHRNLSLKHSSLPANALDASNQIERWQESAIPDSESRDVGIAARLCQAALNSLSSLSKTPTAAPISKREKNALQRCHATLKLWTDGHGVLAGELDQLLDRSTHLQHTTLSVLHSLCRTLLAALEKNIQPPFENDTIVQLRESIVEVCSQTRWLLSSFSESTDDNDSSDSDTSSDDLERSGMSRIVEDTKTYMECLVDLSAALQCPAMDQEQEDGPSILRVEEREAHDYHTQLILAKYPSAQADLIESLGKTSWNRYQRMVLERASNANAQMNVELHTTAIKSRIADSEFQDSGLGTSLPSAPPTSYAETVISFMTSIGGGKRIQIPPLSAEAKSGEKFECNACGRQIRATTNRDWRKHLFLDLQPYTCFYVNCSWSATPFADRQLWSKHLELDHKLGPSWDSIQCPLCLESTEPGKSAILIHFARHMEDIALAALPRDVESDAESEASSERTAPSQYSHTMLTSLLEENRPSKLPKRIVPPFADLVAGIAPVQSPYRVPVPMGTITPPIFPYVVSLTHRCKIYELNNSDWCDRGTGLCTLTSEEGPTHEARLMVRSEVTPPTQLFDKLVTRGGNIQRISETLLVWTETTGTDMALSFQETDGCAEIWALINQRCPQSKPYVDAGNSRWSEREADTSHWTILERAEFRGHVERFGTNWTAIATVMGTKTVTMLKDHYFQLLSEGDTELQKLAVESDRKRHNSDITHTNIKQLREELEEKELRIVQLEQAVVALDPRAKASLSGSGETKRWVRPGFLPRPTVPVNYESLTASTGNSISTTEKASDTDLAKLLDLADSSSLPHTTLPTESFPLPSFHFSQKSPDLGPIQLPPLLKVDFNQGGNDGEDEESSTYKCICGFTDDDGNTVLCEQCDTWQHITCYYESAQHVPDVHECADCQPRPVDAKAANDRQKKRHSVLALFEKPPQEQPAGNDVGLHWIAADSLDAFKSKKNIDNVRRTTMASYLKTEKSQVNSFLNSNLSGPETKGKQADIRAGGTGAKRKYRRHPKPDQHAPERPPSAYVIFSNQVRESLKVQDVSFTEFAKIVGESWQKCPADKRDACERQARKAKEDYDAELAEYKKTPQSEAYQRYLEDFRAQARRSNIEQLHTGGEAYLGDGSTNPMSEFADEGHHKIDPFARDKKVELGPAKKQSKWTPEEENLTLKLRGQGMNWDNIAKRIPGRSAISCRLRYQNYLEKRVILDEEKKNTR